ncbi:hypothetical protein [Fluviicola sp.]|uniref:hypothetical protein n=1 Tax=Fluviicola sp. TaxID=1917219 RepID=UPI002621F0B1|nr:hypothetical protein [Fluviicola sp.]
MKKITLSFFLITSWVLLNSFSNQSTKKLPMGKPVPVNFTLMTSNGCGIIVNGTVDNSTYSPNSFVGTLTLTGAPPCPNGTFQFNGRSVLGGGAGGSSDYVVTFSHSSICSSTSLDWSANTGSDPDIATFLNDYKTAILEEIKEDAGCP